MGWGSGSRGTVRRARAEEISDSKRILSDIEARAGNQRDVAVVDSFFGLDGGGVFEKRADFHIRSFHHYLD